MILSTTLLLEVIGFIYKSPKKERSLDIHDDLKKRKKDDSYKNLENL